MARASEQHLEPPYELRIEKLDGRFTGIARDYDLDSLTSDAEVLLELGYCARIVRTMGKRVIQDFFSRAHLDDQEEHS